MVRNRAIGVGLAIACTFVASSLWYSPVLFGKQFVELSGVAASSQLPIGKFALEIARTLILGLVILRLTRERLTTFRSVLGFVAILWVGFPVILLSGSVVWQNVPTELAFIHAGDWLMKIFLMTTVPWLIARKAQNRSSQPEGSGHAQRSLSEPWPSRTVKAR